MPPTMTAVLPTTDFGAWAARSRLVLPVPLSGGYAARVALPWEELLEISEDRVDVRNAAAGARTAEEAMLQRAVRDIPERARDVLSYAAPILRSPRACVFAARSSASDGELLVVGLSSGGHGLVVTDTPDSVRLTRVDSSEIAASVISALPAMTPAVLDAVELSEQALAVLSGGISERGADRRASAAYTAAAVPDSTADVLTRLQLGAQARGMVGALTHTDDGVAISGLDASWVEGTVGAVLKRTLPTGQVRFEPATRSALVSAAIGAMAGAR